MTDDPKYTTGTAEHAAYLTDGRHMGVVTAMAWLAFSHLPTRLRQFARPFYIAAAELLDEIEVDSDELIIALNKLVEAKDWAVRAGIRSDQGEPGPVPRPPAIIDPPARIQKGGDAFASGPGSFANSGIIRR